MPFSYYQRLSRRQQAIYRRSAAVAELPLNDAAACAAFARDLERALAGGDREQVERSAWRLCRRLCQDLGVPWVELKVRLKRPSSGGGELHGLYEREEGKTALITLWMRTARKRQVVAFKTFLRTLLHELCHHFDYEVLGLADTFHTEGFFRRESHLARQLLQAPRSAPPPPRRRRATTPAAPPHASGPAEPPARQLPGDRPPPAQLDFAFTAPSGRPPGKK